MGKHTKRTGLALMGICCLVFSLSVLPSTYGAEEQSENPTSKTTFKTHLCAINPDGTLKWSYLISEARGWKTGGWSWEWETGPPDFVWDIYSTENWLYVSTGIPGVDNVLAFDLAGNFKWWFPFYATSGTYSNFGAVGPNDRLYLAGRENFYVLNPNGEILYSEAGLELGHFDDIELDNDGFVYLSATTSFQKSDIQIRNPDGTLRWHREFENGLAGNLVLDEGGNVYAYVRIYAGPNTSKGYFLALDRDGTKWELDLGENVHPDSFEIEDNVIYYSTYSTEDNQSTLLALNSDNSIRWTRDFEPSNFRVVEIHRIDDTILLHLWNENLSTPETKIEALNTSNGELEWVYDIHDAVISWPIQTINETTYVWAVHEENVYVIYLFTPNGFEQSYENVQTIASENGNLFLTKNVDHKNVLYILRQDMTLEQVCTSDFLVPEPSESHAAVFFPVLWKNTIHTGPDGTIYTWALESEEVEVAEETETSLLANPWLWLVVCGILGICTIVLLLRRRGSIETALQ